MNTSSAVKTFGLYNNQTWYALNIASIVPPSGFVVDTATTTCGSTLAVGAVCKIGVVFAPTTTGVQTGALTINYGGGLAAQTVMLSGTGK